MTRWEEEEEEGKRDEAMDNDGEKGDVAKDDAEKDERMGDAKQDGVAKGDEGSYDVAAAAVVTADKYEAKADERHRSKAAVAEWSVVVSWSEVARWRERRMR